jgi:hypothetical protein
MAQQPVVFHFQPKEFRVLKTPEELREWERLMKDAVGFQGDIKNLAATCTECTSGGVKDDCDQD